MPFSLIKGTFHVVGYSPDGDSIRFQANDKSLWAKLSGPPAKLNAREHAQLRFEAIDTLETHYANFHQPPTFAQKALDFLLLKLGINGVIWNPLMTTITEANDGTDGYIIAREVEKNHRPVAFVFAGAAAEADGSTVFLDAERVRQSVNYQTLASGLAYPTYYQGLFPDLRDAFSTAVVAARQAGLEIWAEDRTNLGLKVDSIKSVTETNVILPKLFRRIVDYLEGGGSVDGFKEYEAKLNEGILILSSGHFTHFDTVIDVTGNFVKLTEVPENLIFEG